MIKENIIKVVKSVSHSYGYDFRDILTIIEVESPGNGFDETTGKILIQFEPVWFKKQAPYTPSGLWSVNGVERQTKEWIAFNDAFSKNPEAAMLSTSIGMGQIMGFNYKRLGYSSVGEMWDDAKSGLDRQVWQIIKFIDTDPILKKAVKTKNWHVFASRYNGANYLQLAKKHGWVPYNKKLSLASKRYANMEL